MNIGNYKNVTNPYFPQISVLNKARHVRLNIMSYIIHLYKYTCLYILSITEPPPPHITHPCSRPQAPPWTCHWLPAPPGCPPGWEPPAPGGGRGGVVVDNLAWGGQCQDRRDSSRRQAGCWWWSWPWTVRGCLAPGRHFPPLCQVIDRVLAGAAGVTLKCNTIIYESVSVVLS